MASPGWHLSIWSEVWLYVVRDLFPQWSVTVSCGVVNSRSACEHTSREDSHRAHTTPRARRRDALSDGSNEPPSCTRLEQRAMLLARPIFVDRLHSKSMESHVEQRAAIKERHKGPSGWSCAANSGKAGVVALNSEEQI